MAFPSTTRKLWKDVDDIHGELIRDAKGAAKIYGAVGYAFVFVGAIIATIGTFIYDVLDGLFGDDSDKRAREEIFRLGCQGIERLQSQEIQALLRPLLDGPTEDEDEAAINEVVRCANCDALRTVWASDGEEIEDDVHGEEYGRLLVNLRRCPPLKDFSDWNDTASAIFIEETACEDIPGLVDVPQAKALLQNLFVNFTGDRDEAAIIRLLECLQRDDRAEVLSDPNFGREALDEEVDWEEWDELDAKLTGWGF